MKQCPQCASTDVKDETNICPYCGYSFVPVVPQEIRQPEPDQEDSADEGEKADDTDRRSYAYAPDAYDDELAEMEELRKLQMERNAIFTRIAKVFLLYIMAVIILIFVLPALLGG